MNFQFGDKVRHTGIDEEVIVLSGKPDKNLSGGAIWLIYSEYSGSHWVSDYKLERIPDPDTVRLEWLYKNGLSKISKEILFGKGHQIETINDLREAIDDERYRRENPDPSGIVEENTND